MKEFKERGQFVDILSRQIYPAEVEIVNGKIHKITKVETVPNHFILPGFVDAHIHIESSMLVPYEFAKQAVQWGTVATVSDPHEIANVVGMEGVHYMIDNGKKAPIKFHFGAPSCVPATGFETAGAVLDSNDIQSLLALDDIYYLSEMMNYPGVLFGDPEVHKKIDLAKAAGKPIDGHAPGLRGADAKKYIEAGITTDHECFTLEEAMEKLSYGMKVIIREGSAAKNFEALHPLIKENASRLMFCSDDLHPDDLLEGHINLLVKRAIGLGYDLFDVLLMASHNPVKHYGMDVGLLNEGDPADFIVVKDLKSFEVLKTYIDGEDVLSGEDLVFSTIDHPVINNFSVSPYEESDFILMGSGKNTNVIEAIDGELITEKKIFDLPSRHGEIQPDISKDILKIAVVNRYKKAPVACGFIQNFGFTEGAIASTVAHDSHNIIVVGTSDHYLCKAVNMLVETRGGLAAINSNQSMQLGLPIAGLMSNMDAVTIGSQYAQIDSMVKQMGSKLRAPFMTLSFMALLVIPKIKMSDKGLFDAESFSFYT